MKFFENPNYDFVRWRWHAIALSLVVILAGAVADRDARPAEGRRLRGRHHRHPQVRHSEPDLTRVREALASAMPGGGDAVVQNYGPAEQQTVMIRVRAHRPGGRRRSEHGSRGRRRGAEAGQCRQLQAWSARRSSARSSASSCSGKGILATVLALAGILAYIALRFQLSFAVGAIAATLHDLLVAWRSWRSSATTCRSTSSPAC